MDAEKFVQNVKNICIMREVPPTIACRESGAGKNLLSEVARGIVPSVNKVQALAQYLGVTTSELLGEKPQAPVPESGTLSAAELRLLSAYRAAPAPIRAIVDTALEPYKR